MRAEIHTKIWSFGTVADWRYVVAPIDVRLGPHDATLAMARLDGMALLRVYEVSGEGDWVRVFALSSATGMVRGWVLFGDLLHRTRPVQGQHVPPLFSLASRAAGRSATAKP